MNTKYNYAFISYNHKDVKWAKWLQRKLEWYRLPSEIHNEFEDSRYIRPIFRDRDELNSGILNVELRKRLECSKYLIVICSPHAAQSQWVSDEVKAFIEMGRLEYIIPFIIEGEPQHYHDADELIQPQAVECFPLSLREWNTNHTEQSILGISIFDDGEHNRQKAFIRVVSRMLEVDFDVLWKRHKRIIRKRFSIGTFLGTVLLAIILWLAIPILLIIHLADEQHQLPPFESGILYIADNEYQFHSLDTALTVASLPGYMRGTIIDYSVIPISRYDSLASCIRLTMGLRQSVQIQMHRNNDFAIYSGQVLNELAEPISGVTITIDGRSTITDSKGCYTIVFPLEEQTYSKEVIATHPEYQPIAITSYATYDRFILRK